MDTVNKEVNWYFNLQCMNIYSVNKTSIVTVVFPKSQKKLNKRNLSAISLSFFAREKDQKDRK